MISKLLAGKNIYSNRKLIFLGSMQRESDAIFSFYQECFNTVSTLILIFSLLLVLKGSKLFF